MFKRTMGVLLLASAMAAAQTPAAKDSTNEAAENISPADKVRLSAEGLTKMRQSLKDVLAKLEEARNSRDVVKLNCVNEKLTQVKGLLRISEQADVTMQEVLAKKEDSSANHEFTKVSIAQGRVGQLRAEAEQCIGQLAFRTDENLSVDVDVPADLPKGDPTVVPTAPIHVDVRPVPASQTL